MRAIIRLCPTFATVASWKTHLNKDTTRRIARMSCEEQCSNLHDNEAQRATDDSFHYHPTLSEAILQTCQYIRKHGLYNSN